MAVIDPQAAIDAAQPWCCVPTGDLWYAVLAALIDVGEGNPVPATNELLAQVACLKCAVQSGDLPLLLLPYLFVRDHGLRVTRMVAEALGQEML